MTPILIVLVLNVEELHKCEYQSCPIVRLLEKFIHLVLVYTVIQQVIRGEVEDGFSKRLEYGKDRVRLNTTFIIDIISVPI